MPETTDGHILIVGGARSGKTAAVAIPTLMSWKERVFAIDIEGELYAKTKKARGEAQIKVFNPTDTTAYGYDPFYLLKNADSTGSLMVRISPASRNTNNMNQKLRPTAKRTRHRIYPALVDMTTLVRLTVPFFSMRAMSN